LKVFITERAWDDLLAIATYIAAESSKAADTFLDRMHRACHEIGENPDAYRTLPGHEGSGIRRRVVGRYLICYRVFEDQVEILHIPHGSRDLTAILERE
jgi:toxin ParE1/3/4